MIKGEYVRGTSASEGCSVHTGQARLEPTDLTSKAMARNMGK